MADIIIKSEPLNPSDSQTSSDNMKTEILVPSSQVSPAPEPLIQPEHSSTDDEDPPLLSFEEFVQQYPGNDSVHLRRLYDFYLTMEQPNNTSNIDNETELRCVRPTVIKQEEENISSGTSNPCLPSLVRTATDFSATYKYREYNLSQDTVTPFPAKDEQIKSNEEEDLFVSEENVESLNTGPGHTIGMKRKPRKVFKKMSEDFRKRVSQI